MTPRILIIAGSDSGGGAGIQADIKTVTMLGGHAMTAVTAITAQNTIGVQAIEQVSPDIVAAQIDSVVGDIGVDAVKIGMLGNEGTIRAVERAFEGVRGTRAMAVLDPVMVAKGGARLLEDSAQAALWSLMQNVSVLTPNIPELEILMATHIGSAEAALEAGRELGLATGCAVVVKGGHLPGDEVVDWLIDGSHEQRFAAPRINTAHTHGTGCTLASAIAMGIGAGLALPAAVERAIAFVRASLEHAPGLGQGHGPMGQQDVTGFR